VSDHGKLTLILLRYTNAVVSQLAQTAACNRAHPLEERMCRWLLMTRDRVDSDDFPLTQEFLGQMLGVRRPAVSLAGSALQNAGLIRYSRGRVTVIDRAGLEAAACECYRVVRDQFEEALRI
jgi:CRP-like cAMP-binding protein